MATVNEKMTALADGLRALSGSQEKLKLDGMVEKLDNANNTIQEQATLINQIITALNEKGLSSSSSTITGTVSGANGLGDLPNINYSYIDQNYNIITISLAPGESTEVTIGIPIIFSAPTEQAPSLQY